MTQWVPQQYGTYRCPVCSHRDGAVLEREEDRTTVTCTNCETPLVVFSRGRGSVWFSVQVAGERLPR